MKLTNSLLPEDVFRHILDFIGEFKLRDGEYVKQIPKKAPIYQLLQTRRPLIKTGICENSYGGYDEIVEHSTVSFFDKSIQYTLHHLKGSDEYYFHFRILKKVRPGGFCRYFDYTYTLV